MVTKQENTDFELHTMDDSCASVCTECKCAHAQILDLRFVVYSNLGCQGPNKTYAGTDFVLPCEILYYNVLADETQDPNIHPDEVVYMHLRNTSEYTADDPDLNAVTRETEEDCRKRKEVNCKEKRAWGAYGQVNMKAGTYTDFEVYFTKNMHSGPEITYLDKVFQMQFLDIDQGRKGNDASEVGGETLQTCTGKHSWAYPAYEGKIGTKLQHEEMLVADRVCHVVESTQAGSLADNVWNPAIKENGEYVGLSKKDQEKAFIAATYKQNITWTYEVKKDGVNEGFSGRNLVFAAHGSTFCRKSEADRVKEDYFQALNTSNALS